jgi:outer membrane biosynthesis protein TonB
MKLGRQFAVSTLLIALLLLAGCVKKKPQLPSQAKAPVDTVAVPLPDEISEATPPPPPPVTNQEPPAPEPPKPKPTTHHKQKKQVPPPVGTQSSPASAPTVAGGGSNSTVAVAHTPANPAAPEGPPDKAIAADVTSAQLSQQKQTTAQLLDTTEKTVNGLNRTLSHDEEEIVNQIHSYIAQSKKATGEGDFERAYNLATKAHLLSDALIKK